MKNRYSVTHDGEDQDIKVERIDGNLYINIEEEQLDEVKGFLDGHGYACSSEYSGTKPNTKLFKIKIFTDDNNVDSEQLIVQKLLDLLEECPAFEDSPEMVIRAAEAAREQHSQTLT